MKLMIASDIHGSQFYCQQLLEAYGRESADRLLLLGDILYHGPRNNLPEEYAPQKVIELLNGLKDSIFCVRGNCDTEVDQMVLDFPIMAEYCILPIGKNVIFATHGHKFNEKNLPPMHKGDILLNGHTHIPACTVYENYVYMNPGSASIPKNGSWHGYMIFDVLNFQWKDMSGKIQNEYKLSL